MTWQSILCLPVNVLMMIGYTNIIWLKVLFAESNNSMSVLNHSDISKWNPSRSSQFFMSSSVFDQVLISESGVQQLYFFRLIKNYFLQH